MEKSTLKLPNVITIDGPVASGKSSVGLMLAKELGYLFLDTGIMYRAVAWAAINQKVDINDEEEVSILAQRIDIEIKPPTKFDGRINDVLVDKVDITWEIRENEVNENVSQISRYKFVRKALTEQQQELGRRGGIVMAGRDIGTIVMPNAELKFFLEASVKERALRRYNEEVKRGKPSTLEDVIKNVEMRDKIDSGREIATLIPAKDAVIINTDRKDVSRVIDEILSIIRNYQNR